MADRVTQGGAYVGVGGPSETTTERVTQAGAYAGVLMAALGVRDTQGGAYVGELADNDERVTQAAGYVGVTLLKPPCGTTEAQCWRIERTDGEVFAFTAHDEAIEFDGDTYSPCAALSSSALQTSSEFGATENMDLSGIIASGRITLSDLWSGLYDGASVKVYRVDWSDPSKRELLAAGNCGSLDTGSTEFKFEVTTASERLTQRPILQPVMPTCRFKLGDARCTVDLEALREAGTVTTIPATNVHTGARRRIFSDAGKTELQNYWQLGRLTWVTGDNVGVSVDVKVFTDTQFILEHAMQHEIQLGDTYTVVPGCNRVFATCGDKFNNAINFGGFPHLRGTDDLQRTPEVKS